MNYKSFLGKELRMALTGQKVGPPIHDVLDILGKERVKTRVGSYIFMKYENPLDQIMMALCLVLFMDRLIGYKNDWTVEEILCPARQMDMAPRF